MMLGDRKVTPRLVHVPADRHYEGPLEQRFSWRGLHLRWGRWHALIRREIECIKLWWEWEE